MTILLDTSFIIDLLRGDPSVSKMLGDIRNPVLTTISLYELLSSPRLTQRERSEIIRFFNTYEAISFDASAAEAAADIRRRLLKMGLDTNPIDVMIAGIAVSRGVYMILTADKEFLNIEKAAELEVILYR